MSDLEIIIWLQWALILGLVGFCGYVCNALVELLARVQRHKTVFIIDGKAYMFKGNKLAEIEK